MCIYYLSYSTFTCIKENVRTKGMDKKYEFFIANWSYSHEKKNSFIYILARDIERNILSWTLSEAQN